MTSSHQDLDGTTRHVCASGASIHLVCVASTWSTGAMCRNACEARPGAGKREALRIALVPNSVSTVNTEARVVPPGQPATPIHRHQVVDDEALQERWVDMRGFTICAMVIDTAQDIDQSLVR